MILWDGRTVSVDLDDIEFLDYDEPHVCIQLLGEGNQKYVYPDFTPDWLVLGEDLDLVASRVPDVVKVNIESGGQDSGYVWFRKGAFTSAYFYESKGTWQIMTEQGEIETPYKTAGQIKQLFGSDLVEYTYQVHSHSSKYIGTIDDAQEAMKSGNVLESDDVMNARITQARKTGTGGGNPPTQRLG